MAFTQQLQQKQSHKLSPQKLLLQRLLPVPTVMLEEYLKKEVEENPALELLDSNPETNVATLDDAEDTDQATPVDEASKEDSDWETFLPDDDDEGPNYKTQGDAYPELANAQDYIVSSQRSHYEILAEQLSVLNLNIHQYKIAEQLIGSLDDDGYLRRETSAIANDLLFKQSIEVTPQEIEKLIQTIQTFEPAGIAARNLQECLLLQLKRKENNTPSLQQAILVLEKYYDAFSSKHYEKIQTALGITSDTLKNILHEITILNPAPGNGLDTGNNASTYIVPDFFVTNENEKLVVTIHERNAPALRVSNYYRNMQQEYAHGLQNNKDKKDALSFLKQKIDSAQTFVNTIQERHTMLLATMEAIAKKQGKFFLTGDETALQPMILDDIGNVVGVDKSTMSRVVNSKFVQTEFGTYKLGQLFTHKFITEDGEAISIKKVKKMLVNLIDTEDKGVPFSDEILSDLLKKEGYGIERRTIAKYRNELNIPTARLRKKL